MQAQFVRKIVAGGVGSLFLFSSFCVASWDAPGKNKIVKIEPPRFSVVFNDFLREFQNSFPEKPTPPPVQDEFETTASNVFNLSESIFFRSNSESFIR